MSEIATVDHGAGTLALTGGQTDWTPVQRAALDHLGIADAPHADQMVFLHVAQQSGLDPFSRQIYMIPRQEGTGRDRKTKWTIQTGIDGFRRIAGEDPHYRGQLGPFWCGEDGEWRDVWVSDQPPVAARVGVVRDDHDQPIWGVAMFREYAQTTTYDGQTRLTKMWREKGAHMIAKCAEALALRKACPTRLGGLHTDDEMAREDNVTAQTGRAVIDHQPPAPVTVDELTGTTSSAAAPGMAGGRATQDQQSKLFGLIREAEIPDRNAWASQLLDRQITSFGQLTKSDASRLIDNLESALNGAADDEAQDATAGES